jgi:hypothetical protein
MERSRQGKFVFQHLLDTAELIYGAVIRTAALFFVRQ